MRVTNLIPGIQYGIQQSEQSLAVALQQLTTSKRVNQLSDDPSASASMVRSLAASANVDQYTANVSYMISKMQTADSALSSVVTSLNQAITLGTGGANGTLNNTQRQGVAAEVQSILNSVIAQANTSFQGVYVFGGSMSTSPPFVDASTAIHSAQGTAANPLSMSTVLTPGSTTTVYDAMTGGSMIYKAAVGDTLATLAAAVASGVTAGTLSPGSSATIDSAGKFAIGPNTGATGLAATSNDSVLGAMSAVSGTIVPGVYIYTGNSAVNTVQVGDSMSVNTNLPGDQVFTSGANVIGSLQSLIKTLQAGSQTQIGSAAVALTTALNYVGLQRVPLGSSVAQLNSQETYLAQESLSLITQQTSLVGVDIAHAATNLSQAEVIHSAVLAAAAKILPQNLLDYLR